MAFASSRCFSGRAGTCAATLRHCSRRVAARNPGIHLRVVPAVGEDDTVIDALAAYSLAALAADADDIPPT